MTRNNRYSLFSQSIRGLLDATDLYNRREWSTLLGVSEPAISQWLSDKTIPRADNLHMIVVTLEQSSRIPEMPVAEFRAMAHRPAIEVSPHGARMLPTVWEYMTRPASSELSSRLVKLAPTEQVRLLEAVYPNSSTATVPLQEVSRMMIDWPEESADMATAGRRETFISAMDPSVEADRDRLFAWDYVKPTFQWLDPKDSEKCDEKVHVGGRKLPRHNPFSS